MPLAAKDTPTEMEIDQYRTYVKRFEGEDELRKLEVFVKKQPISANGLRHIVIDLAECS